MTKIREVAVVATALAAVCAEAATTKAWLGGDGSVADPAMWDGSAVPVAGEQGSVSVSANSTLAYPAGNWTNPFNLLVNVASGKTVTLDGSGTTYSSPDFDGDGAWEAEPFTFRVADRDVFKIENWWGADKTAKRLGPVAMRNFRIRVGDAENPHDVHFDAGTFNFYNPNGTALENRASMFGGNSAYTRRRVVFHSGTSSHLPGLATIGFGTEEDVLRYEGGEHAMTGVITMPYDDRGATCGEQRVEVDGAGTRLTLTGVGSAITVGRLARAGRTWKLMAANGGTLAFGQGGDLSLQGGGTAVLCATNGGCIEVGTPLYMGTAKSTVTSAVHLVDAELRATTTVRVGNLSALGAATFAATNSTVAFADLYVANGADHPAQVLGRDTAWSVNGRFLLGYRENAGAGCAAIDGGSWSNTAGIFAVGYNGSPTADPVFAATNAVIATTNVFVSGSADHPARLYARDCSWTAAGDLAVGHGGTGEMVIDGGTQTFACAHPVNHTEGGCSVLVQASIGGANGSGRGTLRLRGDDRVTTFCTVRGEFYVANETGSQGWFYNEAGTTYVGTPTVTPTVWLSSNGRSYFGVSGGLVHCYGNFNTSRGFVTVEVSGGRLFANAVNLGNSSTTQNPVQSFTITGGEVETGTFVLANQNALTANLVLDGGVLKVSELRGGNGAGANGGTATASATANGGTIRTRAAGYSLIRDLDSFRLGEAGLTIDAAHDTTVSQDFASMDGVRGRLIKTGMGTLTLTGTLADDVTVEVREGKVVFGSSNEIGALVIGGEATSGAIEIADGAALAVKGDVTIVHDATVGEVTLAKDGATGVTTVTVDVSAAPETLRLCLDAGTSNATEDVSFRGVDTLEALVGTGADLTLSGRAQRGALVKNGPGAFRLTNADNSLVRGVTLNGGLLEATPPAALGLDYTATALLTMTDGTLAFGANGGEEHVVGVKPTLTASTATNALVIRTDSDVTFARGLNLAAGAIVKTGAGRMTVDVDSNASYTKGNGRCPLSATPSRSAPVAFDAFGTAPADGYSGFNVAEGAVTFRGTGSEQIYMQNAIMVGLYTTSVAADPELTFDGLKVDTKVSGYLTTFGGNHQSSAFTAHPKFRLVNGAYLRADTLCFGWNSSQAVEGELYVDNATLFNTYAFYANYSRSAAPRLHMTVTNNAAVYCAGEAAANANQGHSAWDGYVDAHFHDSVMAGSKALRGCSLGPTTSLAFDRGAFTFHRGAKLYLEEFKNLSASGMSTLRFDGGEFTITADAFAPSNPGTLTVDVTANGVTMPVAEEKTVTVQKRITGVGGVTKTGAGTLTFGLQSGSLPTWAFEGTAVVREGTLAVLAGGSTNTASCRVEAGATLDVAHGAAMARVSGAGTVTGELDGATVVVDDEGTLALDCTLAGTMKADFGRTAETVFTSPYPKNVVVANRATGPLGNWRAKGLGSGMLTGVFRLENGQILCDVKPNGVVLIFR